MVTEREFADMERASDDAIKALKIIYERQMRQDPASMADFETNLYRRAVVTALAFICRALVDIARK